MKNVSSNKRRRILSRVECRLSSRGEMAEGKYFFGRSGKQIGRTIPINALSRPGDRASPILPSDEISRTSSDHRFRNSNLSVITTNCPSFFSSPRQPNCTCRRGRDRCTSKQSCRAQPQHSLAHGAFQPSSFVALPRSFPTNSLNLL